MEIKCSNPAFATRSFITNSAIGGAADIAMADEQYFYHGDSPFAFSCNGFLLPPILTGKEVWITVENAFDCCKVDISAIFIS